MTTKDIARLAGVSQSTVSRALDDHPSISAETRARIRRIAEEYGFERNASARTLSTQRCDTIGLIYPDEGERFGVSQYFNALNTSLRRAVASDSFDLIVSHARSAVTGQSEIMRLVSARKVDGLILIDSNLDDETLRFLSAAAVPCIFLDRYTGRPGSEGIGRVYADNRLGGYKMTQYLLRQGRKRILCLNAHTEGVDCQLRCEGYREALHEAGLSIPDDSVLYGDGSFASGRRAVLEHPARFRRCDAVFAGNDMMAFGVLSALRAQGLRVPDDVAVAGYDDIELCTMFEPHLTTVHQPIDELCSIACEHLTDLIRGRKHRRKKEVVLEPELIIRDST